MHGRPRLPPGAEQDELVKQKLQERNAKAAKASAAMSAVLKARSSGNYGKGTMMGSSAVLAGNPDISTLWNVRREALQPIFDGGGEAACDASRAELVLLTKCLEAQPKSYAAWHHRQWVVNQGRADLDAELKALEDFLHPTRGDARNFHAWKYRFWLVQRMARSDEDELAYTQALIKSNRSNFSAWHYRSLLLPRVHAARGHRTMEQLLGDGASTEAVQSSHGAHTVPPIPLYELRAELDFLHDTLAVSPGDSSAWSYHRWLLHAILQTADATATSQRAEASQTAGAALLQEERRCRAIAEREGLRYEQSAAGGAGLADASVLRASVVWPLQVLADVSKLYRSLLASEDAEESQRRKAEELSIYQRLQGLDSRRCGYYKDQLHALADPVA